MHVPNIRAPKYIKQILTDIKGEIDSNTIIVWDSNTPLISMGRSPRQKMKKGNTGLEWHIILAELNRYIENIPFTSSRIHILLKCIGNILQDRLPARPQNKLQ